VSDTGSPTTAEATAAAALNPEPRNPRDVDPEAKGRAAGTRHTMSVQVTYGGAGPTTASAPAVPLGQPGNRMKTKLLACNLRARSQWLDGDNGRDSESRAMMRMRSLLSSE
jgi:hypothetical protein